MCSHMDTCSCVLSPSRVRAHPPHGLAVSWVLWQGISLVAMCVAATLSSQSTLLRGMGAGWDSLVGNWTVPISHLRCPSIGSASVGQSESESLTGNGLHASYGLFLYFSGWSCSLTYAALYLSGLSFVSCQDLTWLVCE